MIAFCIQLIAAIFLSLFLNQKFYIFIISLISITLCSLLYSKNFKNFFSLLFFGLLLLDYDSYFSFSEYNIRLWYIFTPLLLIFNNQFFLKKYSIFYFFCFIYLSSISLIFGGVLYLSKYLLYIATVFVLVDLYKIKWYSLIDVLPILMVPIYLSVAQILLYEIIGIDSFLWSSPRISGYFSESTWLSAYSIFIILYLFILLKKSYISFHNFLINFLLSILVIMLARSLNSIIGLFIIYIYLYTSFKKIRFRIFIISFLTIIVCYFILWDRFINLHNDLSFLGRLEGYKLLFDSIKYSNFFGSGFNYDYQLEVTKSGAALGSKAFSFPFQLYAIGGIPLIFIYLYIVMVSIYSDYFSENPIGILLVVIFVVLSFFSPLAQGIVGAMFIWLRICSKYEFRSNSKP